MALAGPQIGGVSLIVHIFIIAVFAFKKRFRSVIMNLSTASRKISHPYHRDAK